MPPTDPRKRLPSADRRQQILEASARLFVERGFEAVTVGDIAITLGISRPTVYSYFPSTESILDALLDARLHTLLNRLEPLLASQPKLPPGSAAPNLIAPVFRFLLEERDTLTLLHSGGGPVFRARQHDFLREVARRLPLDPALPAHDHPHLLLIITTLLDSLAYRAANDPAIHPAELAHALSSFVRGGVRELLEHEAN
ncbi:AcrR family transcriptional regulator [Deinobacterium chartae]|uniref:AcrR family transcriptional regulator n=1 Tax=Deinobacterium chartae TaxID=521158 RepID=A0A841I500_9DEIO|nr:TetR/AcrR family transcriptional regulator [Deinobacterium chartae]MBB6099359.1 AcrR family transcriptional regulator [Deinobacterium chartae]